MGWSNIVIEGLCFGEKTEGKYPCGQRWPTAFCLSNNHCPHFAYSDSTERDAAIFVPLRLIIWDRIKSLGYDAWSKLTWYLWHKWFYSDDWINEIPAGKCSDLDQYLKQADARFPLWFEQAKKEEEPHAH